MSELSQKFFDILQKITSYNFTDEEKLQNVKQYREIYDKANKYIAQSINCKTFIKEVENRILACEQYNKIVGSVEITEYLLLDANPRIPRNVFLDSLMNLGNYIKTVVESLITIKKHELDKNNATRTDNIPLTLTQFEYDLFNRALNVFITILHVEFEHKDAITQITSIYTQLTYFSQGNYEVCLKHLTDALLFSPDNPTLHYNLGHIYQRLNKLELSLIHYKLSIKLTNSEKEVDERLLINNYNGIASIYRGIKKWPESLHFLLKAFKLAKDDPDINNQLGVVYTEMRRTDLAEVHYKLAITHYQKTFVSTDPTFLLSEVYLNYGHMHSYNGDNEKSLDAYNKALKVVPKFALPFQNKIMNLTYIFDQLEDKMYITEQHKKINRLYAKNPKPFKFDSNYFKTVDGKINIGIISGDFVDHPVSFFIGTYLKNFDTLRFNVTCYSECLIDTSLFNKNLKFKFIKNMSQENVSNLIYNDRIHILLDLAGHTAFNRIDVFSFKPSPIQITYIGYPFTTGLNEMDYRITDNICDHPVISQNFYTEKLLFMDNCFLCYDPKVIKRNDQNQQSSFVYPNMTESPFVKNKYITIGCYNRINKITESVIVEFNKILKSNKKVRFIFKTKALINKLIAKKFLDKFDKDVVKRIKILDCTLTHEQHLETYNHVDIAIDTFPYSGTTTSCEALFMGTPVFSIYDSELYFHPQNVTCSILKNSDMENYICHNTDEILIKIKELEDKPIEFWKELKINTREQFLNGKVCNKKEYMNNLEKLFIELYNKHKIN
jgi:predicted O-linked N-acetylglucosamine transferase (SPINDLY family)